jgi:hypothetical protein
MAEFFPPGFLPDGYLPDGYVAGDGAGGTYVDGAAVVTGSGGLTATAVVTRPRRPPRGGTLAGRVIKPRDLHLMRFVDAAAVVTGTGELVAQASVLVSGAAVVSGGSRVEARPEVVTWLTQVDNDFWLLAA